MSALFFRQETFAPVISYALPDYEPIWSSWMHDPHGPAHPTWRTTIRPVLGHIVTELVEVDWDELDALAAGVNFPSSKE